MRRLLGAAAAAGAMTMFAVAPVNAELEFCLVDPTVVVDGAAVEVGLYTDDANLAHGDLRGPIGMTIIGRDSAAITTDRAAWSQRYQTNLTIVSAGQRPQSSDRESVDFMAFVPATGAHESYVLRVQLPDGSVKTAAGTANSVVHLRVDVPVHG